MNQKLNFKLNSLKNSNITGTHNKEHNCLEDIFATYADWNKRDYLVMYLDSWNFGYSEKEVSFEKRIEESVSSNRQLNVRSTVQMELLKRYAGINIQWRECMIPNEEMEFIGCNIDDYTIAIHIDVYWCPWTPMYQKAHSDHYCLVTSITPRHLVCLDPFNGNTQYELSHSDYLSGVKGTVLLECISQYENPNWRKLLLDAVNRVKFGSEGKSDFDFMDNFILDIFQYESLKKYIETDKDVNTSTLIRRLTQIANGRRKFSALLDLVCKQIGESSIEHYSCQLMESAKSWEYIRNIIIKMYLSNCRENDVKHVSDRLKIIRETESILLYEIIRALDIKG